MEILFLVPLIVIFSYCVYLILRSARRASPKCKWWPSWIYLGTGTVCLLGTIILRGEGKLPKDIPQALGTYVFLGFAILVFARRLVPRYKELTFLLLSKILLFGILEVFLGFSSALSCAVCTMLVAFFAGVWP